MLALSACNTAAGDRPGAQALSGLARAFLYSGDRALLLSHWRADSQAAVRPTAVTFAALQLDPGVGRQRLRQICLNG
jgi:CHAT domain-containing protein